MTHRHQPYGFKTHLVGEKLFTITFGREKLFTISTIRNMPKRGGLDSSDSVHLSNLSTESLLLDGTTQQKFHMLCWLLYSNCPITTMKWSLGMDIHNVTLVLALGGHEINKRKTSFGMDIHNVILVFCSNLVWTFIDSCSIVWRLIFILWWTKRLETTLKLCSDDCCNYAVTIHLGGESSMHTIGYWLLWRHKLW